MVRISGSHPGGPGSIPGNGILFVMKYLLKPKKFILRSWMIRVTQYEDREESSYIPPPGCLQYNYGTLLGTIANFNFKDSSSYHLSNQRYSICWRRERNMCSLCFSAGFFGLSNVPSSVKPSPSSSSTSPWTRKAGYTDSICCNKDNPVANCGTSGKDDQSALNFYSAEYSGAGDYIEFQGASPPPAGPTTTVGNGNR